MSLLAFSSVHVFSVRMGEEEQGELQQRYYIGLLLGLGFESGASKVLMYFLKDELNAHKIFQK